MTKASTNQHLHQALSRLFGEMDDEHIKHILSVATEQVFEPGQYVFKQGEKGKAFYIVLSGRFRALEDTDNGIFILGDITTGEPIGEFSLFTRELHSASVIALRRSTLLCVDDEQYLSIVQEFPAVANMLTKFIIERLRRNARQRKIDAAPKNIAVVNLQPANDVSAFTIAIEEQFKNMGLGVTIYDDQTHTADINQAVFDSMEKNAGLNFLKCDAEHLEWAKECIAYCDLIIVATNFYEDSSLYEIEKLLHLYTDNVMNKKIYLLLLHPENADMPQHTNNWFQNRSFDLHLHIRKNNQADVRRFCRIVTHQAIGLVLGGGGARGFAHVGVVKALQEAGVEFDFIGGTSAGAIYSAVLSYSDFDLQKVMILCKSAADGKLTSNDFTIPFVSIMSGKKMRNFLNGVLGDTNMEDLWVNCYCVSTNYTEAKLQVHERGSAKLHIEASIAIPGVFPPVIINKHLHIDGGVVDNLPVEAMHKKPVRHIIAVSLSAENTTLIELAKIPGSWKIFWDKVKGKNNNGLPGLSSILVNSITINSRHKLEASKSGTSIFLELDLKEYKFLEWGHWQQIVQKGYEQTKQYLSDAPAEKQFWKE
jgi:predicted acylesterase/phospholipase RssA/CRP-like cAMP-binding protein